MQETAIRTAIEIEASKDKILSVMSCCYNLAIWLDGNSTSGPTAS